MKLSQDLTENITTETEEAVIGQHNVLKNPGATALFLIHEPL